MLAAGTILPFSFDYCRLYRPAKKRKMLRKTLKNNQRKMKKWADSCPANFLHKYLLVEAEMAQSPAENGRPRNYDKRSGLRSGYVHIEALACGGRKALCRR